MKESESGISINLWEEGKEETNKVIEIRSITC